MIGMQSALVSHARAIANCVPALASVAPLGLVSQLDTVAVNHLPFRTF